MNQNEAQLRKALKETDSDVGLVSMLAMQASDNVRQQTSGRATLIGSDQQLKDLEQFDDQPRRVRETLEAYSTDGLLQYLDRHAQEDTVLFVHPTKGRVGAVIDYHSPAQGGGAGSTPSWCEHKVRYDPTLSDALCAWKRKHDQLLKQLEFAEHIEERLEDILDPSHSRVLEAAQNMQAKRNVDFESGQSLAGSDDVTFHYKEETEVKGEMTLPKTMTIGIPIFRGGPRYKLDLRVRWQIKSRSELRIGYKILRLEDAKRTAAEDLLDNVREWAGENDVPVLEVSPS
jgi:uncharacterized protein YfdQ (DUF2303 family)